MIPEDVILKLPHVSRPCRDCPFRKDSLEGWLGEQRAEQISASPRFTCHKKRDLQCAGHMLIHGSANDFVRMANRLEIELDLSGQELVFESPQAFIEHQKRKP